MINKNKLKLLLIVQDWISFYNQAEGLSQGLKEIGVIHKLVNIRDIELSDKIYREYRPDVVVGVGSWHKYKEFVEKPKMMGAKVMPWIVSDDLVDDYIDGYNELSVIPTPSRYCKFVLARDGVKDEKIVILPEAVDSKYWHQVSEDRINNLAELMSIPCSFEVREKYDVAKLRKDGVPILLTMGGDATSKGCQEVLRALAKIDKKIKWMYFIKTWPQAHTFKRGQEEFEIIKEHGLEDRIRYIVADFSSDFVRDLMGICDIYVAPSRGEGFGLPFVQAQMCGKPVISIKALSLLDVVVDKKTGLLAEPVKENGILKADVGSLAECLNTLLLNKSLREEYGRHGRIFAVENFAPRVIAEKLMGYINLIK